MDERIRRIVHSQPIPDRLVTDLAKAGFPDSYRVRKYMHPTLTDNLRQTLPYVCQGYSDREIGELRHYSEEAIKDHVKRLLAIFGARRRAHLAALAVARGYVDPSIL